LLSLGYESRTEVKVVRYLVPLLFLAASCSSDPVCPTGAVRVAGQCVVADAAWDGSFDLPQRKEVVQPETSPEAETQSTDTVPDTMDVVPDAADSAQETMDVAPDAQDLTPAA
jgi:hypothetical protein